MTPCAYYIRLLVITPYFGRTTHNAYQSSCTLCTQKEKFVSQNIHNDRSFIILFFVLLLLCLLYKQFVSLSSCYSVFFTSNLSTRSLVNSSTCCPIVKNIKYCIYNNEYSKEYVYICCRLYEVNDSLLIGPKNKT